MADELGATSIAFPAISTGLYAWPKDDAARIALRAVRAATTSVQSISFVLFGDDSYRAFRTAAEEG